MIKMTKTTEALFIHLVKDAPNWSGQPIINVTAELRGNLADLKKKGLITTHVEEGNTWCTFTAKGEQVSEDQFGLKVEGV